MINDLRGLWGEMVIWMRSYISAVAAGYPNSGAIADRIYRIPVDFHDRFRLVFGNQPAQDFLTLLSMNVILTEAIVTAMKNGDAQMVNANTVALYKNADDLSGLLRQINPFWSDVQWRNLLYTYIGMTLQEAVALLSGDFARDIDVFDRLMSHSQLLGDYMANGIIQYLVVSKPIS
jgi:hypothetical protein